MRNDAPRLKRPPRRAVRIALKNLAQSFINLKDSTPCEKFSEIHTNLGKLNNCIMILTTELTGR